MRDPCRLKERIGIKKINGREVTDVLADCFVRLNQHYKEMNAVLACLIAHPQAGKYVLAALRDGGDIDMDAGEGAETGTEAGVFFGPGADADSPQGVKAKTMTGCQGAAGNSTPAPPPANELVEFPLLIDSYAAVLGKASSRESSQKALRVRVYGWTDVVTTATVSLADRLLRNNGVAMIVHFDFEIVYNNIIWICRKRYCQFRALLTAMKRLYGEGIGEELRISQKDFNFPHIEDELSATNLPIIREILGENLLSSGGGGSKGIMTLDDHLENMVSPSFMSSCLGLFFVLYLIIVIVWCVFPWKCFS